MLCCAVLCVFCFFQAKRKAEEDAAAALAAEAAAQRKAEREARKREKLAQRAAQQEAARQAAEKAVLEDIWTQEQQNKFEAALLVNTSAMDKWDRWTNICRALDGEKTRNQCIMRYRYLKEYVIKKKELESAAL